MTDTPVQKHPIVVGVDGSAAAEAALDWAAAEAVRTQVPVHLVYSYTQPLIGMSGGMAVYDLGLDEAATQLLDRARDRVQEVSPGVVVTTASRVGAPSLSILDEAKDASMVVVGHRGHGALAGAVIGSTALQVATHATCPTVVVRDLGAQAVDTERKVVVGTDGSATSTRAVADAFAQARARGCELVVVHAWSSDLTVTPMTAQVLDEYLQHIEQERQAMVADAVDTVSADDNAVTVQQVVVHANPIEALIRESTGAELLVVGSRGRGGFRSLLLGSVSQKVLQHAQCPVMIVRELPEDAADPEGTANTATGTGSGSESDTVVTVDSPQPAELSQE